MANKEMDVIWRKEKVKKVLPKVRGQQDHGRGDTGAGAAPRVCRLCGLGRAPLRRLSETRVRDGTDERHDQLLFDCFGICISQPNCLICEDCIRQLESTRLFRTLVFGAFDQTLSHDAVLTEEINQDSSQKETLSSDSSQCLNLSDPDQDTGTTIERPIKVKPKAKIAPKMQRRGAQSNVEVQRVNVACSVCKQRYPMMLPYPAAKMFICSRCRMKSRVENRAFKESKGEGAEASEVVELKAPMRRKSNRFCMPKKPLSPLPRRRLSPTKALAKRYECSQSLKKYSLPLHLAEHATSAHGNNSCACAVCGKDMRTREELDKHMLTHNGDVPLHQCDVCMRVFKSKRVMQKHSLSHGVLKSNSH